MLHKRPLTDEEHAARDARVPRPWVVWRIVQANLGALITVVVSFITVAALVVYNGQQDQNRDDRQVLERRRGICLAIVEVGPVALARALQQDTTTDPEAAAALLAYQQDLYDALGFCPQARP